MSFMILFSGKSLKRTKPPTKFKFIFIVQFKFPMCFLLNIHSTSKQFFNMYSSILCHSQQALAEIFVSLQSQDYLQLGMYYGHALEIAKKFKRENRANETTYLVSSVMQLLCTNLQQ